MSDDYYDLLGVEPDAEVSDIRAAYRDKKAEVADRTDDDAKADAAALNKAWNVLSDPYQRGRYDQSRADAGDDDGDASDADDDVVDVPATRTRTTRTNARTDQRKNPRAPEPTITLPAGIEFASTRKRFVAMGIDILVLIALFVASFVLTDALERSNHPSAHHIVATYPDKINKAKKVTNEAKKGASKNVDCTKPTTVTTDQDKTYCEAGAQQQALQKTYDKAVSTLAPTRSLISGLYFVLALLILVIPSMFGGQTLGKRLQGIRLAKLDGSRVGAAEVFRRYGALALAAFALYSFLGPLGPLIVVFVATLWQRNPNRQGLQDRFAHTIVVSDTAQ